MLAVTPTLHTDEFDEQPRRPWPEHSAQGIRHVPAPAGGPSAGQAPDRVVTLTWSEAPGSPSPGGTPCATMDGDGYIDDSSVQECSSSH